MSKKQKKNLIRIIITAALVLILELLPHFIAVSDTESGRLIRFTAYLAVYLIISYDILVKAAGGILRGRMLDENFLMAIASVGAFFLAIWTGSGDYLEAVAVMLFYQIGELFEGYAVGRSRRSIAELMDIRPDYANIEQDGTIVRVDPDEVAPGTVIVVQPGEKVPIDGIIEAGTSAVNNSALTGESIPVDVAAGDEVFSGSININGVLRVRTTREFGESTASKILDLVENASSRKSRSEDFISRFALIYTPAVCGLALLLAVIIPLVRLIAGLPAEWETWIYRGLTFLVVSCPCALVISIPLSFFAGLGCAGREGILIKGSNYLEALSKAEYMVFDKTGTLTKGVFEVVGVHCGETGGQGEVSQDEVLELAALSECASSHPISQSIKTAYGKPIDRNRVTDIEEISGHGVTALADGRTVAAGNDKLMKAVGVKCEIPQCTGTVVHVAADGRYLGYIEIADVVKETSAQAIRELKDNGIRKTVMLTGDSSKAAERIGAELGIDEVYSGLLPADKVDKVEKLIGDLRPSEKSGKARLAFAGDGINDAPVLTRSDIGIAMGALGSDAAIEAADVVLMHDDPMQIVKAMKISRRSISIVYENIIFSLAIKFACLILTAFGITGMWAAIFADTGVLILAVLNSIRALRCPK